MSLQMPFLLEKLLAAYVLLITATPKTAPPTIAVRPTAALKNLLESAMMHLRTHKKSASMASTRHTQRLFLNATHLFYRTLTNPKMLNRLRTSAGQRELVPRDRTADLTQICALGTLVAKSGLLRFRCAIGKTSRMFRKKSAERLSLSGSNASRMP